MRSTPYIVALLLTFGSSVAHAEHPIEVQRLTSQGEHYKALTVWHNIPRRQATTDATIAAARSSWALGLAEQASALFDDALRDDKLPPTERARVLLSKGIIEFQEKRVQVAALFAERAAGLLKDPSPLRAKVWALSGQAQSELKNYGAAEEFFLKALEETPVQEQGEIHFHLGEVRMALNKYEEASRHFESIPLGGERTPSAIRHLGELAILTGQFDRAAFWLEKGRADYPDSFLDSWTDYALVQAGIAEGRVDDVRTARRSANARYPGSDFWLAMLNSAAEVFEWRRLQGGVQEVSHGTN